MFGDGLAGQVLRLQRRLNGMALKADLQGPVLGEGRQRPHADVGLGGDLSRARQRDVVPAGAVTRFAVDGQCREAGVVTSRGRIKNDVDLAAVALLATLVAL